MGLAIILFIFGFITILVRALIKHIQLKRIIDKFHGPEPYWLVGNALHIKRDPFEWQEQSAGVAELWNSPRVYRIWFFLEPYVVITGPEEAEPVLSSIKNAVKSSEYEFLRPWLGRGLFVNGGEPWRPRRKLMSPAFHGDIIRDFVPVFNRQAKLLTQILSKYVGKGPFNVYDDLSLCALSIIWESTMGTDPKIQLNRDDTFVRAVQKMGEILYDRQRAPWFWPDLLFKAFGRGKEHDDCINTIHKLISQVVEKRWHEVNCDSESKNEKVEKLNGMNGSNGIKLTNGLNGHLKSREGFIILDYWLEQVKKRILTLKDVNEEANSLLFGGFDTTATSQNWVLFFIGASPDVQAKVHQEIDTVLGTDDEREITFEDTKNLIYLECCIKEALRLYPPASIIGRRIVEDHVVAGRLIPAGTQVLVSPYSIHRDPRHWDDPERFIPERFLPENQSETGRHPFAFIPFSAGIRNCIAQRFAMLEEKVTMATIFRKFKVKSAHRPDQIRSKPDIILRPDRVVVELELRR